MISLKFESKLRTDREKLWTWISSVKGISKELWPLVKMTVPPEVLSIENLPFKPGVKVFRSYLLLGGLIPFDYWDLTLTELTANYGFVENSTIGLMQHWRYERIISEHPTDTQMMILTDQMEFAPRFAPRMTEYFVKKLFEHRHKVLQNGFNRPN